MCSVILPQGKVSLMQLSRSNMGAGIIATLLNLDNLMQVIQLADLPLKILSSMSLKWRFGVRSVAKCTVSGFVMLRSVAQPRFRLLRSGRFRICRVSLQDRNTSEWGAHRAVPLS